MTAQSSIKRLILGNAVSRRIAVMLYLIGRTYRLMRIRISWKKPLLVLFRAGGLGDIVATAPAVSALHENYPGHTIVYCTRPEFRGAAALLSDVDTVLPTYHGDRLAKLTAWWCDARSFRYPDEYDKAGSSRHFVEEMAESVGAEVPAGTNPELILPAVWEEHFEQWFGKPINDSLVVALHVGPSAPVKEWTLEKWRILAAELASRPDVIVIQIGNGRHFLHGERDLTLESALQPKVPLSIVDSARLLKRCDLLIGIDSGPLHVAAGVGTKCIGLYGPVNPELRAPRTATVITASPRLDCQFCHHRLPRGHWETNCPQEIRCMSSIEPSDVLGTATRMLDEIVKIGQARRPFPFAPKRRY